jgi:hypothetical protein
MPKILLFIVLTACLYNVLSEFYRHRQKAVDWVNVVFTGPRLFSLMLWSAANVLVEWGRMEMKVRMANQEYQKIKLRKRVKKRKAK